MKQVFILLCVIFIFFSCSSNGDEEIVGTKYLQEILIKEHTYKFGEPSKVGDTYEVFKYSPTGKLIKKTTNYYKAIAQSRIEYNTDYIYDEKGRLVDEKEFFYTVLDYRYMYSYNSIDSISEKKKYNKDGRLYETWTYEYEGDKLSEATKIINYMSSLYGYTYKYSYEGNKIIETAYKIPEGSLWGVTVDEYDSKGNFLRNTWTNAETGKTVEQRGASYEYDSKGRVLKMLSWGNTSTEITYKDFFYSEEGVLQKVHLSYSYKQDESDLIYHYTHK